MKKPSAISILFFLLLASCIDRIDFDTGSVKQLIVIDGYISDQPGEHKVRITRASDAQSRLTPREPVTAKRVTISDNLGGSQILEEESQGVYTTGERSIQGVVGRAYHVTVELLDGRVYQSFPDTLHPTGQVDSIYYNFLTKPDSDSTIVNGFDVFFNSSAGTNLSNQFMWKFKGTFKIDTNPELYDTLCVEARCPKPLFCSGYVLDTVANALRQRAPCSCCTCWVNFFDPDPIISDDLYVNAGQLRNVKASFIPITQWTFMYKVRTEISQLSLSTRAFKFWRIVRLQRDAVISLFQPASGKIPNNFIQLAGPEEPALGIFYATSISSRESYLTRRDVPRFVTIPPVEPKTKNSCLKAFPNASTEQPSFWIEE